MIRHYSDNIFHDAVSEVLLLGITAHVLKRQHSDRGLSPARATEPDLQALSLRRRSGLRLITRVSILTLPPSLQPSRCKACRTGVRRHRSGSCRSYVIRRKRAASRMRGFFTAELYG